MVIAPCSSGQLFTKLSSIFLFNLSKLPTLEPKLPIVDDNKLVFKLYPELNGITGKL